MALSGIGKVQHYVPQFLLRKLGNGKKDQLYVFDKHTSRQFRTNAKNIASESRFYDFRIENEDATLEPMLAELEGATKPLIGRILEKDSVSVITDAERELLSKFLAVQLTRTKAFREQMLGLSKMIRDRRCSRMGGQEDLSRIEKFVRPPNENELKIEIAYIMMTAPRIFGPLFLNKDWLLIATTRKAPFVIGDNPLALQNTIDIGDYGNLGLAVKGIEIYLPLSPVRVLAIWCPSLKQTIVSAASILRQVRAWIDDAPLPYSPENVRNFNSLQVRYAERFVFSSVPEFALAHEMVNSHPSLRTGMRIQTN